MTISNNLAPDHIIEAAKAYFNCGPGKLFVHPQNPEGQYYMVSLNGTKVDTAIFAEDGTVVYAEGGYVSGLTVLLNDLSEKPAVGLVIT